METAQLADKLVSWIEERATAGNCRGVVLGMSGGVDSSVVAVLCRRAFPENALGVIMPCYSQPQDEEHALMVAGKFNITTEKVVLDSIFDALLRVLPQDNIDSKVKRLAEANLKARLRMLTLYHFANQFGYMVVGAGNRSELSVGYFTKYGDGGVDVMPLGNLVKGQVVTLARFLGIPRVIIDKPPSAGLWLGQTDEADMGCTYDEIDLYLSSGGLPENVRKHVAQMAQAAAHKGQMPPSPPF